MGGDRGPGIMRIGAIIQARMGSSRLPGKVLMDLDGTPMLAHVVARARKAARLDTVVVATSTAASDTAIAAWCAAAGVSCERGSEHDVLDRYRQTAVAHRLDAVVRLTADCPLLDPSVIDQVVGAFQSGAYDYVSNTQPPTFPDGLDTEVFTHAVLTRAWSEAMLDSEREHVTPYIWKRPEVFRLSNVTHIPDLSGLRWTVDDAADLDLVRMIVTRLPSDSTAMQDVIGILESNPDIATGNAGANRNAGYFASLRRDATRSRDAQ